jgi:hypothetical protein
MHASGVSPPKMGFEFGNWTDPCVGELGPIENVESLKDTDQQGYASELVLTQVLASKVLPIDALPALRLR